jgi:hypothetical protein
MRNIETEFGTVYRASGIGTFQTEESAKLFADMTGADADGGAVGYLGVTIDGDRIGYGVAMWFPTTFADIVVEAMRENRDRWLSRDRVALTDEVLDEAHRHNDRIDDDESYAWHAATSRPGVGLNDWEPFCEYCGDEECPHCADDSAAVRAKWEAQGVVYLTPVEVQS